MSIIGKILGIAKKNNAQLYEHNGLTPTGGWVHHTPYFDYNIILRPLQMYLSLKTLYNIVHKPCNLLQKPCFVRTSTTVVVPMPKSLDPSLLDIL